MRDIIRTSNGITLRTDVATLQSALMMIRSKLQFIVESKQPEGQVPVEVRNRLRELMQVAYDAVFTAKEFREDNELLLLQEGEVPNNV